MKNNILGVLGGCLLCIATVGLLASADVDTSGTTILFEERTSADKVDGEQINRAYITSVSYSSSKGSVVSDYNTEKKIFTEKNVVAQTPSSKYRYKIFGVYRDDANKDIYFQDTASAPIAVHSNGDVYFTSFAQSDALDYELMDYNKGVYQFTINAYDTTQLDDKGSPKEVNGSGAVFTVRLSDNLDELAITPQKIQYSVIPTTPGLERRIFNITTPKKIDEVADFTSVVKNERGVLFSPTPNVIPELTFSYVTKYQMVVNIQDETCENDSSFFTLNEDTGVLSFKKDELLSEACIAKKASKTKYEGIKISIFIYKVFTPQTPPSLGKTSHTYASLPYSVLLAEAIPEGSSLDYSESYSVTIQVAEPVVATPAPVVESIVTNTASSGNGGYDPLLTYKPTPTALPCEKITYTRYPENRGKGVATGLFSDAQSYHRAYKALIDLGEQKVVNGDQATGNARINDPISRAEFVKIVTVGRQDTLGTDLCLKASLFPDVPPYEWFSRFVWNMESRDFVNGYDDGYYRPARNINLAESYKIIALAFGYITPAEAKAQVEQNQWEWYMPYKRSLEKAEVVPAWLSTYALDQTITRGDMFALLSNVLKDVDGVL